MDTLFKLGKTPSFNDMFIIDTRGFINSFANSTSKFVGKLFGPQALEEFIPLTLSNNSVLSHGFRNMLLLLLLLAFPK